MRGRSGEPPAAGVDSGRIYLDLRHPEPASLGAWPVASGLWLSSIGISLVDGWIVAAGNCCPEREASQSLTAAAARSSAAAITPCVPMAWLLILVQP